MKAKGKTKDEIEERISQCHKRIGILQELGMEHLIPPHHGELKLLKHKLKSITNEPGH